MNFMNSQIMAIFAISVSMIQLVSAQTDSIPQIRNATSPVTIDGEVDALWSGVESYDLIYMINGNSYPAASDCSGYFKAVWRSDSLYLLMHVTDNIIGTSSGSPWENDGFEIYFDMDNSKDSVYMEDNYQFRFNLNSTDITGTNGPDSYNPPDVKFEINTSADNSSIMEVVFPLIFLGMESPVAEKYMGFDVQILDNDGSGRECALAWNNNEHEAYFNPSKMGTVYFSTETIATEVESFVQLSSMYPNPVNDMLSIESDSYINSIRIFTADGKLIKDFAGTLSASHTLYLGDLEKGIYFLEIRSEEYQSEILKFIKN